MLSYSRRAIRRQSEPAVTQADVARFLSLSPAQRFIEIRDLRTKAAHLSGGSLAAFTAIYLSVLVAALPLLASAFTAAAGITGGTFTIGVILLLGGLWISYAFVRAQHRWARATVRLQFFQETQSGSIDAERVPDSSLVVGDDGSSAHAMTFPPQ